ncbi:MAG: putative signal transducing protein [Steroidobacteraceae bacterium]
MRSIRSYPTRLEADLARIALEGADIPALVLGIGTGMEGGAAGVQLLVPDDRVDAALQVLKEIGPAEELP